jgi:glycerophosphoryl diester phosphodiesterase
MCELKATPGAPDQDQANVDAVVEVIRQHGAEGWTAIHSFNADMVQRARNTEPRISAAIITGPIEGGQVDRLLGGLMKRNAQAISVEHHAVNRALIEKAKRRQVSVWTWTADDPADWAQVVEAGVDGIITNVPSQLRKWLRAL